MQHDRKPLRAALAALGGIQRTLAASPALVASCVSLVGCTHETRMVPLSPDAVRNAVGQVERGGDGRVVDTRGTSHEISRDTTLETDSRQVTVGSLIDACGASRTTRECLLDRPSHWQFPERHLAIDTGMVAGAVVLAGLAGLAYGNYECFGPGCGTAAKVAVGVGDALVVGTTVLFVEALKGIGASSCGPLAPPRMPREEA